jgi:hypothetical protein
MFKPGDVRLITIVDDDDPREFDDNASTSRYDARGPESALGTMRVQLPHSCDAWVIGDATAVRAMITELQTALKKMEGGERG